MKTCFGQIEQFLDTAKNRLNWQAGRRVWRSLLWPAPRRSQLTRGQAAIEDVPDRWRGHRDHPRVAQARRRRRYQRQPPQLETEGAIQAAATQMPPMSRHLMIWSRLMHFASDQELMQKQQAVREAKAAREEADARLAEIQRTIEDGRRRRPKRSAAPFWTISLPIRRLRTRPNALLPRRKSLASRALQIPKSRNASVRRSSDSQTSRPPRRSRTPEPSAPNELDPTTPRPAPSRSAAWVRKARSTTRNHSETPANGTQAPQTVEAEAQRNRNPR